MAKFEVKLSIGLADATREDEFEIDDEELAECETEEARERLIEDYAKEWSYNYLDLSWEQVS